MMPSPLTTNTFHKVAALRMVRQNIATNVTRLAIEKRLANCKNCLRAIGMDAISRWFLHALDPGLLNCSGADIAADWQGGAIIQLSLQQNTDHVWVAHFSTSEI